MKSFRATRNQVALFVLDQHGGTAAQSSTILAPLEVEGPIHNAWLTQAVMHMACSFEVLRTRFCMQDDALCSLERQSVWRTEPGDGSSKLIGALVETEPKLDISFTDLGHLPLEEQKKHVNAVLEQERIKLFSLELGPLFRSHLITLGPESAILIFLFHHIILDGMSGAFFVEEFVKTYEALESSGILPSIPEQSGSSFSDLAIQEARDIESGAFAPACTEWKSYLEGLSDFVRLDLSERQRDPASASYIHEHTVIAPSTKGWLELARQLGVSPLTLALTAITAALRLHTGADDIAFFATYANRKRFPRAFGYLVNSLPLRVVWNSNRSLHDLTLEVRKGMKLAHSTAHVPAALILQECLPAKAERPFPLLNVLVNSPIANPEELAHFETKTLRFRPHRSALLPPPAADLALTVTFEGTSARFQWHTSTCSELVKRFSSHVSSALRTIVESPDASCEDIPWLGSQERQLIETQLSPGAPLEPRPAADEPSLSEIVIDSFDGEWTRKSIHLLAEALRDKLGPESSEENPAAILGGNSGRSVATELALWHAEKPWLFLSDDLPEARLRLALEQSGAEDLLVTTPALLAPDLGLRQAHLDEISIEAKIESEQCPKEHPTRLAYAVFTSGTTGTPKCIGIERRNLSFQIAALSRALGLDDAKRRRYLLTSRLSFDASLEQIFLPWMLGGTIVVPEPDLLLDPSGLWDLVASKRVDVLSLVPSFFRAIAIQGIRLPDVELAFFGGEELTQEVLRRARALFPNARIFNGYGPTETTINACIHDTRDSRLVLGRPLPGFSCHIVDDRLRPVPIGVRGQLLIGGPCVGRSYLGSLEETEKRFIDLCSNKRVFCSGDVASWNEDGTIRFHGREDSQVKVRGYRVDLREIEGALGEDPSVKDAAVIYLNESPFNALVAFVQHDEQSDVQFLLNRLARQLPSSHIPAHIFSLTHLPRSANGKLDTGRLQKEAINRLAGDSSSNELTETEAALAAAWKRVLPRALGPNDDILQSGLDSLGLLSLLAAAAEDGIDLSPKVLFEERTLRRIASRIPVKDAAKHRSPIVSPKSPGVMLRADASQHILITGATGFLGAHLLAELRSLTPARITCLVRAGSRAHAKSRLQDVWSYYFGSSTLPPGVTVVAGDIEQAGLGLDLEHDPSTSNIFDAVVHLAADVHLLGDEEEHDLHRTNVLGTKNIVDFCQHSKATLHHASSLSVGYARARFLPYVQSKHEAEQHLISQDDMSWVIYRIGLLVGRHSDGLFHRDAASSSISHLLENLSFDCKARKSAPILELTPVDCCARALATLIVYGVSSHRVLNVFLPEPLDLESLGIKRQGPEASDESNLFSAPFSSEEFRRLLNEDATRECLELLFEHGFSWPKPNQEATRRWISMIQNPFASSRRSVRD